MKFADLFMGALTLKHETFVTLRERSDVFLRGFVVLLVAALVAGAFASLGSFVGEFLPPPSKDQIMQQALNNFESSYTGPAALKPLIEAYIREGVSLVYELIGLPPRAGEGARPIAAILEYVGNVLATPFTWAWIGWTLFAGLLYQFTAYLLGGRASMAQTLGLTSLAAAPQIFSSLTALLSLIATRGNIGALDGLASLLGFGIVVWSAVIYVKALSVAQNISIARAVAAIALGYVLLFGVFIVVAILLGLMIGVTVNTLAQ